ncbi:MAG: ComF family protein [Desulfovibrio sp.]|jgi:ComF family protein|nr:ComF family protein [Desulfovibrio sp.]
MTCATGQLCGKGSRSGVFSFFRARFGEMVAALCAERRCRACAAVFRPDAAEDIFFCPDCAAQLVRRERGFCPLCGKLYVWPHIPVAACADCLKKKPPWERLLFHGEHKGLLRRLLLDLKFRGQTHLGSALGTLLSTHPDLRDLPADILAPVPLHRDRLLHRGYNQALELARPMSTMSGLSLQPELLRRTRATLPQTRSGRSERTANVSGAFECARSLRGRHILLMDDTLTTGATAHAAATALLDAGAAGVCVVVVSRVRNLSGLPDQRISKLSALNA